MKIGQHVRQGDVLVVKVKSVPAGANPVAKDARGIVLMEGELTGHHHRFKADGSIELLETADGERFVTVEGTKKALTHEEHSAIMFADGKFQQMFQVEDFGEEVRQVAD